MCTGKELPASVEAGGGRWEGICNPTWAQLMKNSWS